MGRAHAVAYRNAAMIFGASGVGAELIGVADPRIEAARELAGDFGFADTCDDWRILVDDPRVQLIDIAAPNHAHAEIAIAAAEAGKHTIAKNRWR